MCTYSAQTLTLTLTHAFSSSRLFLSPPLAAVARCGREWRRDLDHEFNLRGLAGRKRGGGAAGARELRELVAAAAVGVPEEAMEATAACGARARQWTSSG